LEYGCNPTGVTASLERRKDVLALAREHNFIILEGDGHFFRLNTSFSLFNRPPDDPYYYLYYGEAPRSPSYFALELEEPEIGRVIRFDSMSKVLSAGIRIGFASGPERLIEAIDLHVRKISSLITISPTSILFCRHRPPIYNRRL
jgi:tryptophan aminotransferase